MLKRFFRYIRALFSSLLGQVENPEVILEHAREELQENLLRNKERAVQAITERNRLRGEAEKLERACIDLERRAEMALRKGDRELAKQFLLEKASYTRSLEAVKQALAQAEEVVEQVKIAIKRDEERVRQKTAEILAQKARWKSAQIQSSINKALEGMSVDDVSRDLERVEDKISRAEAEAQARAEMARESVVGRMAQLDDYAANQAAEEELAKLELRLGIAQPTPAQAETSEPTTVSTSEIDKELQELEAKVNKGSNENPAS
ncbi:MAG: PspA/IM30 family protein [Chthonomonadetes bacterium]|nr:PspA/IM30 family protein [Chthonomonadetes bacterium]